MSSEEEKLAGARQAMIDSHLRKRGIHRPDVLAVFEEEVEKAMKSFAKYEKVRKFTLIPREFTIEAGELTPSLKVKRKEVVDHFGAEIEAIYADAGPAE